MDVIPDRVNPTRSQNAKGDDRRAAILSALEELLVEHSFKNVQISEITRRAGVTRSGFYFYFPTKAAAVGALLANVSDELLLAGTSEYDANVPPETWIRAGVQHKIQVWRKHAALLTGMLDAVGTDADAANLWHGLFDTMTDRAAERIAEVAGDSLQTRDSPTNRHVALAVTAMGFALMERDVRAFHMTGVGFDDTEDALTVGSLRIIYSGS